LINVLEKHTHDSLPSSSDGNKDIST